MKARQLISQSSFDHNELRAIGQAFDDAWDEIGPQVGARAEAVDAARYKLAKLVLSLAKRGVLERKELKDKALELMFEAPAEL